MITEIKNIFLKYNIDCVGFCGFDKISDRLLDCRAKHRIMPDCRTVITFLLPYYTGEHKGNLCKYAAVPDYHAVADAYITRVITELKRMNPSNLFEGFCDNSPVPEVYTACISGLGVAGKNGLLINEKYGSFVFIAEMLTDLDIDVGQPSDIRHCKNCGLCEKACYAGAINDKSRCLSKITQQKAELTDEQCEMIKRSGIIWGCDICQDVCPHNKSIALSPIQEFYDVNALFCEGDSIDGRAYAYRGRKVIERNLKILKNQ